MPAHKQIVVLLCAILAFASLYVPSDMIRESVLEWFGNPPYEGVWILIPHLFLYSTVAAIVCAVTWCALSSAGWVAPLQLQALVAAMGFLWCVIKHQTASMWAPWISHTGLDIVADSWIG